VEPFAAWAVHPLVPDLNVNTDHPCGHDQVDQIPGPFLGGRQRVHACRNRGRVLLHDRRRRETEPTRTRGTSQAGGVAGHPVDAVRWQFPVLFGGRWNGNGYS